MAKVFLRLQGTSSTPLLVSAVLSPNWHWKRTLDVGKLEAGPVLCRPSSDSSSYELVPIDSVQVEFAKSQVLHGVHLRESHRRYHANGNLVALNYPEIMIKSVAAALEKLPPEMRLEMLKKIKDLRPLFIKIGIDGVHQLLASGLRQAKKGKLAPIRIH
ncbi:uncharacterized protein Z519_07237 [Cladophialophora bantiana CBS 173.52]|uniref:Uncharacterized protein n=1 Tax=Cladophialophora bantiana (strain ATCC 10958 / CBS 173.52 / CDC B-1940 / NIH 8579) TaxID=1442370 RepID=A0A0D2HG47_CLAB1|nr:uncharacterized protein Z519_07237 [Cladophialophora bantiana CBS 173.52]KIW92253.1 hypothetical protein Z519_07237 [Cladophialophora bantiana CBS 173.52]